MFSRITQLSEKKLIGLNQKMSLAENKTHELWRSFMPRRSELKNRVSAELISLQVYPEDFNFEQFNFFATFDKWALAEVNSFEFVPEGMKTFTLTEGMYAVFLHKGPASEAEKTFRYIFESWLPASGYALDQRPHFEILGEKYKNNDPSSEEEVWIPIAKKN